MFIKRDNTRKLRLRAGWILQKFMGLFIWESRGVYIKLKYRRIKRNSRPDTRNFDFNVNEFKQKRVIR